MGKNANYEDSFRVETDDVQYAVSIQDIINQFHLEVIFLPEEKECVVKLADVNRPGFALCGFFGHFEPGRIQIIGRAEHEYLSSLSREVRFERAQALLSKCPSALIFTTQLNVFEEFVDMARLYHVPILRTEERTSAFMASLIASLNVSLAPRITRHGVLVEVYGEGVLILGDSGVGKSETAIELVKRGHRLIADDAVEIKRVSAITLVGSAPEMIRYYIELRGIGIVDVRRLFGMGAVKETEKIDLVVKLEPWDHNKMYDRLGIDSQYTNILGINVPITTIPVKPGRNLAIILEIAAMNHRQKKMGYNTAEEFNRKLLEQIY